MEVWSSASVSLLFLLAAVWLMRSHTQAWRTFQQSGQDLEVNELDYRRRQYRRRMQTSGMLGVLAIALLAGCWVKSPPLSPLMFTIYWGGVILIVIWLGMLAVVDIISTKFYFGRVKRDYMIENARLEAQARRLQRAQGNGRTGHGSKSGNPASKQDPAAED